MKDEVPGSIPGLGSTRFRSNLFFNYNPHMDQLSGNGIS